MYKLNDMVVVRKRNLCGNKTYGLIWNPKMDEYVGKTFTVRSRVSQRRVTLWGADRKDVDGWWVFDEDWLDPACDCDEELDCGDFAALISNF